MRIESDEGRQPPASNGRRLARCGLAMAAANVHAVDADAGDTTTPPVGRHLVLLYLQHSQQDKQYAGGDLVDDDGHLYVNAMSLRWVRPFEVGTLAMGPQVIVPTVSLRTSGSLSALGDETALGDVILTFAIWPIRRPETRTHMIINPFVIVPTGRYDRDSALNIGENRYRAGVQLGYGSNITDNVSVEVFVDGTFYAKNDEFTPASLTLRQKPLYQAQAWLSWHASPTTVYAAGLSNTFGGEGEVEGIDQGNRRNTTKFLLTTSRFVNETTQLLFSVGRDLEVENGGKESARVNFRLLKLF
ncbi:transporter [Xanthomonas hortorum]|uniref:Transporter n=2 Tax=Xanthomonas hortorum TaxID=56454 RepID=A0A9X3YZ53_9XANT|nr:transporter [Xanthomonas hortorum]MCE4369620.1 transporter [Xanthomonas hortorum pv. hederae]MDC8637118.1 transporter [Xanthomonas hortorum pv. hederae]PPU86166.1 hypothetical protein XhhCFBP4925_00065 [Xanthomonas hortorum pv. hederae]PUF01230.1 transporter [Xanthomonas hortorum pv. hederae]